MAWFKVALYWCGARVSGQVREVNGRERHVGSMEVKCGPAVRAAAGAAIPRYLRALSQKSIVGC